MLDKRRWKFLQDTSQVEIEQMMAVPYFSAAWLNREFLPDMLKRGSGNIVNICSVASRFVWPRATAYIAARWAIRGFSEALRADLYGTGIGVTLYESGEIESTYWENNPGSRARIPKVGTLMIPVLAKEHVANAIVRGIRKNKSLIVMPYYDETYLFTTLLYSLGGSVAYHSY